MDIDKYKRWCFSVKVPVGRSYIVKQCIFTFIDYDEYLNAKKFLEEALSETENEEKRNHNIAYAYRVYLNSCPFPPLPHHRYIFDYLPDHPFIPS